MVRGKEKISAGQGPRPFSAVPFLNDDDDVSFGLVDEEEGLREEGNTNSNPNPYPKNY
jgi:hypothetical protein